MKLLNIIAALLISSSSLSQDCNISNNTSLVFEPSNGTLTLTVEGSYPCAQSSGGINYFTGPGGCVDCNVAANTPFNLDWGVTNILGCTATNSFNHSSWDGSVDPLSGGSGDFNKTILNGLPQGSGTTTFTLDCPSSTSQGMKQITVNVGGINYFTGPGGCVDCNIAANTPFNLDWGVNNILGCNATNSFNHSSWNGNVEPLGGGSGNFSKTIQNGLPSGSGTTTFTLDCPSSTTKNYNFNFIKQDVIELNVPPKTLLMLQGWGNATTILNVVIDKNIDKKGGANEPVMQTLKDNLFFSKITTKSLNDISLKIDYDKKHDLPKNIISWLMITEDDPRTNGPKPYTIGNCDSLGRIPRINISTDSIMKTDLLNTCNLVPDKQYYLVRVYLGQ